MDVFGMGRERKKMWGRILCRIVRQRITWFSHNDSFTVTEFISSSDVIPWFGELKFVTDNLSNTHFSSNNPSTKNEMRILSTIQMQNVRGGRCWEQLIRFFSNFVFYIFYAFHIFSAEEWDRKKVVKLRETDRIENDLQHIFAASVEMEICRRISDISSVMLRGISLISCSWKNIIILSFSNSNQINTKLVRFSMLWYVYCKRLTQLTMAFSPLFFDSSSSFFLHKHISRIVLALTTVDDILNAAPSVFISNWKRVEGSWKGKFTIYQIQSYKIINFDWETGSNLHGISRFKKKICLRLTSFCSSVNRGSSHLANGSKDRSIFQSSE